jgi:hypothetical protein
LIDLVTFCDEHDATSDLLDITDRDTPLVIAMCQKIVDERKAAGLAKRSFAATEATREFTGHWSTAEVFAYMHLHDLPVHPAYAQTGNGAWQREHLWVGSLGGHRGSGHGRTEWEELYYPDEMRLIRAAK